MSFSKTLENILKNNGKGPEVKDEILSKHITVQDWDSSITYQPGEICRGGGRTLLF